MVANITQMNYETMNDIARHFEHEAIKIYELMQKVGQQTDELCEQGWMGEAADRFHQEVMHSFLPQLKRLSDALDQSRDVTLQASQIFREAEEQAAGLVNRSNGSISTSPNISGQKATQSAFNLWGLTGNAKDVVGAIFKGLGLSDTLGNIPKLKHIAGLAPILDMVVDTPLTYLEYQNQEPDLIRGGGIAAYNTSLELSLGLLTGSGSEAVEMVNSGNQLLGTAGVIGMNYLSENLQLSDDLRGSLERSVNRYNTALNNTDVGDLIYNVARVGYDVDNFETQAHKILPDTVKLINQGKSFVDGLRNYQDAAYDMVGIGGIGVVNHFVNQSDLSTDFKNSIGNVSQKLVNMLEKTDFSNPFGVYDQIPLQ